MSNDCRNLIQFGDLVPMQFTVCDSYEPMHLKRCVKEFLLMTGKAVHDLCPVPDKPAPFLFDESFGPNLAFDNNVIPYPAQNWSLRSRVYPRAGEDTTVVWIDPVADFAIPFKLTILKHDLPAKTPCRVVLTWVDGTQMEETHPFAHAAVRLWVQMKHITKSICESTLYQLSDSLYAAFDVLVLETETGERIASYRVEF